MRASPPSFGFAEALIDEVPGAMATFAAAHASSTSAAEPTAEFADWLWANLEHFCGTIVIDDLRICGNVLR